jgi:hypothetical protein
MEFYAWLPRVCEWIVELAVRLLPPEDRDRWRQEFQHGQNAIPQTVWRLLDALWLCCGAVQMSHCLTLADLEDDLGKNYAKFEEINSTYRIILLNAKKSTAMIELSRETVPAHISAMTACGFDISAQTSNAPMVAVGNSVRQLAATLSTAHDQATRIFAEQISARAKRLAEITPLIDRTERDWKFARRVWSVARFVPVLGPVVLEHLLSYIDRDLTKLNASFIAAVPVDPEPWAKAVNITDAIRRSAENLQGITRRPQ